MPVHDRLPMPVRNRRGDLPRLAASNDAKPTPAEPQPSVKSLAKSDGSKPQSIPISINPSPPRQPSPPPTPIDPPPAPAADETQTHVPAIDAENDTFPLPNPSGASQPPEGNKEEEEEEESKPSYGPTVPPHDAQGEPSRDHNEEEEEGEESKASYSTAVPPHDAKEEPEPSSSRKEEESQPPADREGEQPQSSEFTITEFASEFRRPTDSELIIARLAQEIAPPNWPGHTTHKQYSVSDFAEFLATLGDASEPFTEHLKDCFARLCLPITDSAPPNRDVTFWVRPPGKATEIEGDTKWRLCAIFDPLVPQLFTIGEGSFWREVRATGLAPLPHKTRPNGSDAIYKRDMNDDFLRDYTS